LSKNAGREELNQDTGTTEDTEGTEELCPYFFFPCLPCFPWV